VRENKCEVKDEKMGMAVLEGKDIGIPRLYIDCYALLFKEGFKIPNFLICHFYCFVRSMEDIADVLYYCFSIVQPLYVYGF
jgi:hypothetical protein